MVGSSKEIVQRSIPFVVLFLVAVVALKLLEYIPLWVWVLLVGLFIASVSAWVVRSR